MALVTGGSRGLGAAISRALAATGHDVAVVYRRDRGAALRLTAEIGSAGARAMPVQADVADPDAVANAVAAVAAAWGRLDVLVHNAGPFLDQPTPVGDLDLAAWREMIEGNLSSAFYLVRAALPALRRSGSGRIVFIGFAGAPGAPPWPGRSAYAAAKVGLVSLMRTLSLEEAPARVTVNMVCPGDIRGRWKESGRAAAAAAAGGAEAAPVGRPGTGEDVARAVAFLADPLSDFITGAVIDVAGGFRLGDSRGFAAWRSAWTGPRESYEPEAEEDPR